jgi:hypothetical protein
MNSVITSQDGNYNRAWATQTGDITNKKSGNENWSEIMQDGNSNYGRVVQENGLQWSMVSQTGNNNSITVRQD